MQQHRLLWAVLLPRTMVVLALDGDGTAQDRPDSPGGRMKTGAMLRHHVRRHQPPEHIR
jgi:hypothetical protein